MGKTLREKLAKLPKDRQERIKVKADELIAEEMTLRELRKQLENQKLNERQQI
jgi:hypothetical protein